MSPRYEYMTLSLKHMPGLVPPLLIEDALNELAADGWRLIQILEKHHYPPLGILERELPLDLVSPR